MSFDNSDQWRELSIEMRRQGRLADAVSAGRRALEFAPDDARAWNELAHALRFQGHLSDALDAADRALQLRPDLAAAWFNRGAALEARNEIAPGIAAYRKALELQPDFAEAWSNLGGALGALGKHADEIDAYRRALAINPGLAPVWSNLGEALRGARKLEEAISACRRAVELDPGFAPAWNNLANGLHDRGEHELSLQACDKALQLSPRFAEALSSRGNALQAMGRFEEALDAHRRALEIQPGNAELHFNLGVTLRFCGRSAEAIASYRRGLAIKPGDADASWNLSLALLTSGELGEGWDEYEARWSRRKADAMRYDFRLWNGDVAKPCRLLVWGEQGVGDEIIYSSMVAELAVAPLSVTLEADPRLVPLFQRSFPGVRMVPRQTPTVVDPASYDCQTPLASLGRWRRRSFGSFPRQAGFLKADPSRIDAYRKRLRENAAGPAMIVGISWRSKNEEYGAFKSLGLVDLKELLSVPRARFIDLQYGDTAEERAALEAQTGVNIGHLPDLDLFNDLEGIAALCAACDLVITVSNVTAHVAGAVGCPVWLLTPHAKGKIWYWFTGRPDSPWYPSMRIFTQQTPGDWRETLDAVAREIGELAVQGIPNN